MQTTNHHVNSLLFEISIFMIIISFRSLVVLIVYIYTMLFRYIHLLFNHFVGIYVQLPFRNFYADQDSLRF